jgi:hypothetical protein
MSHCHFIKRKEENGHRAHPVHLYRKADQYPTNETLLDLDFIALAPNMKTVFTAFGFLFLSHRKKRKNDAHCREMVQSRKIIN